MCLGSSGVFPCCFQPGIIQEPALLLPIITLRWALPVTSTQAKFPVQDFPPLSLFGCAWVYILAMTKFLFISGLIFPAFFYLCRLILILFMSAFIGYLFARYLQVLFSVSNWLASVSFLTDFSMPSQTYIDVNHVPSSLNNNDTKSFCPTLASESSKARLPACSIPYPLLVTSWRVGTLLALLGLLCTVLRDRSQELGHSDARQGEHSVAVFSLAKAEDGLQLILTGGASVTSCSALGHLASRKAPATAMT